MFLLCFTGGMTRNKPDICPSPWKGLDGICDRRGDTCQGNADCDRQGGGKCCFNGCQKDCVQFGELNGLGRGKIDGFASLRRRRSKPSVYRLYKGFRRVRGPAATQAMVLHNYFVC